MPLILIPSIHPRKLLINLMLLFLILLTFFVAAQVYSYEDAAHY